VADSELAQGHYGAALSNAEIALAKARALGAMREVALAQSVRAAVLAEGRREDIQEALTAYQEARRLFDQLGDRANVAALIQNVGAFLYEGFDLPIAEQLLRQTVEIFADLGDPEGEVKARLRLSIVVRKTGRSAEAQILLSEVLREETLPPESVAYFVGETGIRLHLAGRLTEALREHEHAKELFSSLDHQDGYALAITNIAEIYYLQGNFEAAEALHRAALGIHEDEDNRAIKNAAYDNLRLGKVRAAKGNYTDAEQFYERAAQGADGADALQLELALAELDLLRDQNEQAEARLRDALRRARDGNEVAEQARLLAALARACLDQGKLGDAREASREALAMTVGKRRVVSDFRAVWESRLIAARVRAADGEIEPALSELAAIRALADAESVVVYSAECLLAMVEIERREGEIHLARRHLAELHALVEEHELGQIEKRVSVLFPD